MNLQQFVINGNDEDGGQMINNVIYLLCKRMWNDEKISGKLLEESGEKIGKSLFRMSSV